jgi:hypothetical protein
LKREEAISVIKELFDRAVGLDGCGLELAPPISVAGGYQIVIRGILDEKTRAIIAEIVGKHHLAIQVGNIWKTRHTQKEQPDTLIIFKSKK